jgi:zinc/manganese transport system substrate-binding protein
MTARLAGLLVVLAALLAAGPAAAEVRVEATVPDLAALARAVGGPDLHVTSMAVPTQDPHFVDAKPSLALDLSKADLLVVVGLDLEVGWLPPLQTGSRNPRIQKGAPGYLDASTLVTVLERPAAPVDRSMGDVHPGGSPHYLHDPRRAILVAEGIAARLAAIDPAGAGTYRANAAAFRATVEAALPRWTARAAALRGAPVVVYHRSWGYLADWLGFRIVAELEPKPGVPPTAAHVARVVGDAKAQGVTIVLQEAWFPTTNGKAVCDRTGARLVVAAGGTDFPAGQTYVQRVDALVAVLAGSP